MNQCGTPAGRWGWSWARCRTGTLRVCAGMLALAALGAVPALAQDVERAPSAVLLDTTLTVGNTATRQELGMATTPIRRLYLF